MYIHIHFFFVIHERENTMVGLTSWIFYTISTYRSVCLKDTENFIILIVHKLFKLSHIS